MDNWRGQHSKLVMTTGEGMIQAIAHMNRVHADNLHLNSRFFLV